MCELFYSKLSFICNDLQPNFAFIWKWNIFSSFTSNSGTILDCLWYLIVVLVCELTGLFPIKLKLKWCFVRKIVLNYYEKKYNFFCCWFFFVRVPHVLSLFIFEMVHSMMKIKIQKGKLYRLWTISIQFLRTTSGTISVQFQLESSDHNEENQFNFWGKFCGQLQENFLSLTASSSLLLKNNLKVNL